VNCLIFNEIRETYFLVTNIQERSKREEWGTGIEIQHQITVSDFMP